MKKTFKNIMSFALSAAIVMSLCFAVLPESADAYTLPVDNLRIGLSYGTSTAVFATVSNVDGHGSGFKFGYYDGKNAFVPIDASTEETSLSIAIDKNLIYDTTANKYVMLTDSTYTGEVIGCYHIQLSKVYETYAEAMEAANTFTSYRAFAKYTDKGFLVCVGAFRNSADARAAAETLAISSEYTINSGTTYTVTVIKTGTSEIVFEFDCANAKMLGVLPILDEGDTLTKYGSYRYYGSFRFHRIDGGNITVVNVVDMENYVRCSVPYESYPSWPVETLKAQTVAARSYSATHLDKHWKYNFDLCNTADCQVYRGDERCSANSNQAVDETKGQYLAYNGKICQTFYVDSNGGASESVCNVWGSSMTTYPYLKGKIDPYEADVAGSSYSYTKTYTGKELTELLKSEGYDCADIISCEVTKLSDVGNPIEVTFTDATGRTFVFKNNKGKQVLGARSQRFTITNNKDELKGNYFVDTEGKIAQNGDIYAIGEGSVIDKLTGGSTYAITGDGQVSEIKNGTDIDYSAVTYTISGTGNGHNVGMSQWGAYSMCKYHGKNYIEILQFYFDGTEIITAEEETDLIDNA